MNTNVTTDTKREKIQVYMSFIGATHIMFKYTLSIYLKVLLKGLHLEILTQRFHLMVMYVQINNLLA
jgi:hypothetical protein